MPTQKAAAPKALPFDPIAEARRHWEGQGWAAAAAGMAAVTSVMRVQQIFMTRVDEVLRPFGLTFARYEALMLLRFSSRGSLPLGKVGERLQVHAASVTNAIDRLEADGLVVRQAHPTDGRVTLAELTPAGRALTDRATEAMNALFETVGGSSHELEEVIEVLSRFRRAAGDFE
jgi:DNA-binding MarR family transcriptional regulator